MHLLERFEQSLPQRSRPQASSTPAPQSQYNLVEQAIRWYTITQATPCREKIQSVFIDVAYHMARDIVVLWKTSGRSLADVPEYGVLETTLPFPGSGEIGNAAIALLAATSHLGVLLQGGMTVSSSAHPPGHLEALSQVWEKMNKGAYLLRLDMAMILLGTRTRQNDGSNNQHADDSVLSSGIPF